MNIMVTIGYNHYLVQSKKDASTIVIALSGAVRMERKFVGRKEVFYPADRQTEVGMTTVMADQLAMTEPPDHEEKDAPIPQGFPAPPKQLGFKKG